MRVFEKHNKVSNYFMQMLKNIALFLFGALLIIFGYKANTDKAAPKPEEKEGSVVTQEDSPEAEKSPAMPAETEKAKAPAKPVKGKSSRAGKTRLEKKAPEKAGGST